MHDEGMETAREESRVGHYWREIFKVTTAAGNIKHPHLAKVVKAALVLPLLMLSGGFQFTTIW